MPEGENSFRHKLLSITIISVMSLSFVIYLLPLVKLFLIVDYKTDKILYYSSVKPGDKFSITYIHSVNKSPVEDKFLIDRDYGILLLKTVFKSFGAGIPSNPDDGGKFTFYKDRIEVEYNGRKIGKLLMFVGIIADHHFLMNGKDIRLNELSLPQRSVLFQVKKLTVFDYLKLLK